MNRVEGVKITHHVKRLETFDSNFYGSFNVVIAGLDNVEARRWLNSMLVSLVKFDDEGAVNFFIPFIDGGTEAFRGLIITCLKLIFKDKHVCFCLM